MADDRKSNPGDKKQGAANKVAAKKVAVKAAVSRRVVSKATKGTSKAAVGKATLGLAEMGMGVGSGEPAPIPYGGTTRNDRLIAVAADSRNHSHIRFLGDLNTNLVHEIEQFFVSYNQTKGKRFELLGRFGPDRATQLINNAHKKFRSKIFRSDVTFFPINQKES